MKILLGPDQAHPAPPELAAIFTAPDPLDPAPTIIKPRNTLVPPGQTNARDYQRTLNFKRRPSDFIRYANEWLDANPADRSDFDEWLRRSGPDWSKRLSDYLRRQIEYWREHQRLMPDGDKTEPPPPTNTKPLSSPSYHPNTYPRPDRDKPQPLWHPPYTIRESATQAAIWLSERWTKDAQDQGLPAFIEARRREVLEADWNPRYWQPLEREDPQACVAHAFTTPDPDWDKPPFNDAERRRSIATYPASSAPYPLPAFGTAGLQPYPGFLGAVASQIWHDYYSAAWIETYRFPYPYEIDDMRPIFLDAHSHHHVHANLPPTKVQFGTYSIPILYDSASPRQADTITLPLFGRRFNWTTPIAPGGPSQYNAHMARHFVQDLRVLAMMAPSDDQTCSHVRVKLAPLAAMGRYFGEASEIRTDYTLTDPAAYIAKTPDAQDDPIEDTWGLETPAAWTSEIVDDLSHTCRLYNKTQAWDRYVYIPQITVPLGSATFRNLYNGRIWSAPHIVGGQGTPVTLEVGPEFFCFDYSIPEAYNMAYYATTAGGAGMATIYRRASGEWGTVPGIQPLDQLRRRLPDRPR